ncbi:MAG: SLC13 family permease [Eubacteriales bacterium]|nr:SLC13 family permease [Eubacteriales bacterium]
MDGLLNWGQTAAWLVLLFVLYAMISEKIPYAPAAFGGLLVLGFFRIAAPAALFSGFSSPALFTVAIVLVMSAGIVESGIFYGFGKAIAARVKAPTKQLFAVFLSTSLLSAFMNNVGAIGIMLPTSKRMARRAGQEAADFGMPLAYASILGGSVTLIGTASNLIISTYRFQAYGASFRMFDFAAHGIAIIFTGMLVLFVCRLCGLKPSVQKPAEKALIVSGSELLNVDALPERNTKKSMIVLCTLVPVVLAAAGGLLHPAVGFGLAVIIWLALRILSLDNAVKNINIPVILFLGSMLSLSSILESTGALRSAADLMLPLARILDPFPLILLVVCFTALFANILDNAVAAVIMAPLMIQMDLSGTVAVGGDALLMAVAAGASLGIVLPTHQAAIVAMESTEFSRKSYIRTGAAIALPAAVLAAGVIYFVWY